VDFQRSDIQRGYWLSDTNLHRCLVALATTFTMLFAAFVAVAVVVAVVVAIVIVVCHSISKSMHNLEWCQLTMEKAKDKDVEGQADASNNEDQDRILNLCKIRTHGQ
tara:strand:- start:1162 stop:1482 length:321 start_codon:yes stop_codon:yes gene_type:complete